VANLSREGGWTGEHTICQGEMRHASVEGYPNSGEGGTKKLVLQHLKVDYVLHGGGLKRVSLGQTLTSSIWRGNCKGRCVKGRKSGEDYFPGELAKKGGRKSELISGFDFCAEQPARRDTKTAGEITHNGGLPSCNLIEENPQKFLY